MTATATRDAHQQEQDKRVDDEFHLLHVDSLAVVGDNIRRDVGDVTELAASIKADGMIEPIIATMRPVEGDLGVRFAVVAGHRRLAAAKLAGLEKVPVLLRAMTEEQRVRAMLVENLQREDLTPLEEARAYKRLLDEFELTQRQLAEQVGKSQGHISKRLGLLEIPEEALAALDSGGITIDDALELVKLRAEPKRMQAAWKRRGQIWGGVAGAVKEQLDEKLLEDARERATERLNAAGVRIVNFVKPRGHTTATELPKGAVAIQKNGGWNAINIDPTKHASEPCHAGAIDHHGEIVYVCTDRKRHPKLKTGSENSFRRDRSAPNEKQRKWREHDKQMQAARDTRRAHIATILVRRLPKDDAVAPVVDALMFRAESEAKKIACRLLALEPAVTKHRGHTEKNHDKPLRELAAKSPADRLKVGLAVAFATSEIHTFSNWSTPGERERAYLDFLAKHGYKVSDAEKLELTGKAPKRSY